MNAEQNIQHIRFPRDKVGLKSAVFCTCQKFNTVQSSQYDAHF